jgi:hypothetical protein
VLPYLDKGKQLYDERITKANFVTAVRQNGDNITISNWERLLSQVYNKYGFATEPQILIDMLCMDMEGIHNFKKDHFATDRKPSLSEAILQHLTPGQQQEAANTVLQRLQNGIAVELVFENHLALCRRLEIHHARDTVLSFLLNKTVRSYLIFSVVEIFIELGGDWAEVVAVLRAFDQYDVHAYFQLVSKLKKDYPDDVAASLMQAIKRETVSLELRMNYAQTLMELGNIHGFYFISKCLRAGTPIPSGPPRRFQVEKLDTEIMLHELSPLIPSLAADKESFVHKDARSILIDL